MFVMMSFCQVQVKWGVFFYNFLNFSPLLSFLWPKILTKHVTILFLGNENFVLLHRIFDGNETHFFLLLAGLRCSDDSGAVGELGGGGGG